MRVLDLFSGIGGFSLGLERAGMRTIAFCEIEPYCRSVLAKHWPAVPILGDIRAVGTEQIAALEPIDVICGGFPCQDLSVAGKGIGLRGSRSGLWSEYARLIGLIRPRYAIVENVSALLARGLEHILGDLAEIGYDAQWHCIPASHVGAPHRRDRIWIIAYPNGGRFAQQPECHGWTEAGFESTFGSNTQRLCDDVADTTRGGLTANWGASRQSGHTDFGGETGGFKTFWAIEPEVGRVVDGTPRRVDRLKCLGNAVIPQIPELLGRAIMSAELALSEAR